MSVYPQVSSVVCFVGCLLACLVAYSFACLLVGLFVRLSLSVICVHGMCVSQHPTPAKPRQSTTYPIKVLMRRSAVRSCRPDLLAKM